MILDEDFSEEEIKKLPFDKQAEVYRTAVDMLVSGFLNFHPELSEDRVFNNVLYLSYVSYQSSLE